MAFEKRPLFDVHDPAFHTEQFAVGEDAKDALRHLRSEFIIPTKGDLKNKHFGPAANTNNYSPTTNSEPCTYLCGNSLGLQPRRTSEYIKRYLDTWASKGVYGHFKELEEGLPPWLHIDDAVKEQTAKIVGALPSEVVVMETLTANLHLLLASFYKPTKDRYKIIIEGKAFPSDYYAAISQLALHNLPSSALITITPSSPDSPYLSTEHILSVISQHHASTALVLLPGIQFYSGQFFQIDIITRHAQSLGITVGWDLAHAMGNVPLHLHDWNVDFAAWCNYKYMNGGPGVIGGLFVHERHGRVDTASPNGGSEGLVNGTIEGEEQLIYRPRLSGWWGSDKSARFRMDNKFVPIPGASGFQLSNPSALDMTAVTASLDVFAMTSMQELREKSLKLTAYLELRLQQYPDGKAPYRIITPLNPNERGAQLSVRLEPCLLDAVMEILEEEGVVVDERRPDVVRVAPAPLYNSFLDVHNFVTIFQRACKKAKKGLAETEESVMVENGKDLHH
ncbi:kynureninase [Lepidopterella palustris CBS 459.81]|uniref:Kynureninase n=1 Tax=Lepidopterella palustris CBS 459.81 TaxID=1314670 RepID=A0A8E2EM31_9PEZI|nr:kynureninase [Lepidopterella palustris CBS 459.81]